MTFIFKKEDPDALKYYLDIDKAFKKATVQKVKQIIRQEISQDYDQRLRNKLAKEIKRELKRELKAKADARFKLRKTSRKNKPATRLELREEEKNYIERRFKYAIDTASRKNQEWTIEYFDYENMISTNTCTYCKSSLNKNGIGLDRLDSLKGYTKENCVACCYDCNKVKSNVLTYEEMLVAMKVVQELRNSKKD